MISAPPFGPVKSSAAALVRGCYFAELVADGCGCGICRKQVPTGRLYCDRCAEKESRRPEGDYHEIPDAPKVVFCFICGEIIGEERSLCSAGNPSEACHVRCMGKTVVR